MTSRRRRSSTWRISILAVLIAIGVYVNSVIVPQTDPLFIPTPTPTLSPESFVNQGEELYAAGKLNQAIEAYKQAVLADPTNPAVYVSLARLQVFAGQYADAIENTQNALIQNNANPQAHAVQGWALGFQEKYVEAEVAIKKALELDPNSALAHAYYAEILIAQASTDYGLLDKAIEESQVARNLDPSLLETHRARGIVLLNTQNVEESVLEFQAALAINKNIADLHLNLGVAYKALQNYDKAQESLLAAYALNPTDTIALTELSRSYFADGRYAQAAQYAEEAVKVDPENPYLHGNLGITYYKNNDFAKAIPALGLAVRGGATEDGVVVEGLPLNYGRIEEFYWYYGFALVKSNRCREAIPVFQALLSGVPGSEIAQYNATEGLAACQAGIEGEQAEGEAESTPTAEDSTADEAATEETAPEGEAATTPEP